ncbi:hypothetical protein [Azoarcus sp. TTM-91]|uniref:hypothetical protein n=1 Tax=Azoarcus sp. TTM-91 TaxID=2691581 RepID=UPI001B7CE4BB|nr:hypothetical protein [Azoarcus sp. TTM-91]
MSEQVALHIAADHPAFAGHFPGRPIVPGVVLLDEAARTLEAALGLGGSCWTLGSAKFLAPVHPGTPLSLRWQPPSASGAIAFTVEHAGTAVASGTLTPRPAPQPR